MQRSSICGEDLLEDCRQVRALVAHVHLPRGQRLHQAVRLVAQGRDKYEVHVHVRVLQLKTDMHQQETSETEKCTIIIIGSP